MYRTEFWTLWEKARVGWSERTALKHVYYQVWNRSPVQVGCMRQVLRAGALGWPRGMGGRGRWEGGSEWGTHINPWLIHVNVWQKPLKYCKVISLQLIKIIGKKKERILEWVAMPSCRGSSQPRNRSHVSYIWLALSVRFFTTSTTWEAHVLKRAYNIDFNRLYQCVGKLNKIVPFYPKWSHFFVKYIYIYMYIYIYIYIFFFLR